MATGDESKIKADSPSEIADLFNQYFASVFTKDREMLEEDVEQQPTTDPHLS